MVVIIAGALLLSSAIKSKMRRSDQTQEAAEKREHQSTTAATIEKVKARQLVDETHDATLIDLKSFINTSLTDSPSSPKGITADNLAELPKGRNIYAGVPFDVEGYIQLMGHTFDKYGKRFPVKVEHIPIGRACSRIHVLHGTSNIPWETNGIAVARIILHYASGDSEQLDFIANAQSFDFWGPASEKYGLPHQKPLEAAEGTELAWIGTNPWVQKWVPSFHIRLYRTTFSNPRPAEVVTDFDFVSLMAGDAAPFMVGMTVE